MHDRPVDPQVLPRVLESARTIGPAGIVVFDLDSTVLDNRPRQARILREFGAHAGLAPLTACLPEHWTSWSIAEAMARCGLQEDQIAAHAPAARAFWQQRFFTSEYCQIDDGIPGAVPYLHAVLRTGAQLIYCTGRHVDMGPGTLHSLRRLGLPLPAAAGGEGQVRLLMKPALDQSDDEWKRTAGALLATLGQVVAAFDNEPTHINIYHRLFPAAQAVHLLTDESGRPERVLPTIPSVHHFLY